MFMQCWLPKAPFQICICLLEWGLGGHIETLLWRFCSLTETEFIERSHHWHFGRTKILWKDSNQAWKGHRIQCSKPPFLLLTAFRWLSRLAQLISPCRLASNGVGQLLKRGTQCSKIIHFVWHNPYSEMSIGAIRVLLLRLQSSTWVLVCCVMHHATKLYSSWSL